jgi:chromosome partitioning protein
VNVRTIAIANHKAGVGKTSTTHALGTALAQNGQRILLIDFDPQANLTAFCGVEDAAGSSIAEVIGGGLPGKITPWDILREILPGMYLFLAPSDLALAATELGLTGRMGREFVLRRLLRGISRGFDIALIDCPSNLGLLTVNALTAADGVIIPTFPQVDALRNLWLFLGTLEQIRRELNPDLETLGILVTYFDQRLTHHRVAVEVMQAVRLPVMQIGIKRRELEAKLGEGDSEEPTAIYLPNAPEEQAELVELVEHWAAKSQG